MRTVFLAAVAATAAAFLAGPGASATPIFPLAPPCDSYKLSGFGSVVSDLDPSICIGWAPDGQSASPGIRVPWHYLGTLDCVGSAPSGGSTKLGRVTVDAATDLYDKPDGNGKKIG